MSPHEEPTVTSAEVLNRIRSEIEAPANAPAGSAIAARMARIQAMQRDYRVEPLGGRLLPIKKIFHWFVASTFDRQARRYARSFSRASGFERAKMWRARITAFFFFL